MTVRVSTHTVSRIMRLYFKGLPQANVAIKAGVDQSTVSMYASRFKDRAEQVGLLAAGKEFGVYNEVDGLRSLSAELARADVTVEEARQGVEIIRAFKKLGVSPNRHADLVRVCKEVDNPGFVQAALKLAKLEAESKLTYEEANSRLETAIRELPQAEQKVKQARSEFKSLNDHLDRKRHEVSNLEAYLVRLQNEANTRRVSLDQELTMKMNQAKVREKEIEEVAILKKELDKKRLNLQTLIKLAEEFPDESAKVSGTTFKQALEKYGSLRQALEDLEHLKKAYETHTDMLKDQAGKLRQEKAGLLAEIKELHREQDARTTELQLLSNKVQQQQYRYSLFEGFLAMLKGSHTLTKSIQDLIRMFQWVLDSGWDKALKPADLRGIFLSNVMGDYLNCFRCHYCGITFIINRRSQTKEVVSHMACPICHYSKIKPDDAFLSAMVSEKQVDDIHRIELLEKVIKQLQKESKSLWPFKMFIGMRCEVCKGPVTDWTVDDILRGMNRIGWGHTQCWNSTAGQLLQWGRAHGQKGPSA